LIAGADWCAVGERYRGLRRLPAHGQLLRLLVQGLDEEERQTQLLHAVRYFHKRSSEATDTSTAPGVDNVALSAENRSPG
jgi:hypothetical protein